MTYHRTNPFPAHLKERKLLTKSGSSKEVYHISLSLKGSGLSYAPGDSLAIFPQNAPSSVDSALSAFGFSPRQPIVDPRTHISMSARDYFASKTNLQKPSPALLKALGASLPEPSDAETPEPIELLSQHPTKRFSPEEAAKLFLPLLPRFYSIASSPLISPEEADLVVASVSYVRRNELRYGVASSFLCARADASTPIFAYVQPARNFHLPDDPNASIIMIGAGTGIAPFRAFLQHRIAAGHFGRNWLFFGERNRSTDFYYEEFWTKLEKQHRLKLSVAFSRDSQEKVYVHHRMREEGRELWHEIERGAYIYVCGDASEMAKDVEAALMTIAAVQGNLSEENARTYISDLRAQKRYLTDVY